MREESKYDLTYAQIEADLFVAKKAYTEITNWYESLRK